MTNEMVTEEQKTNAEKVAAMLSELSGAQMPIVALATESYMNGFIAGMQAATKSA